MSYILPLFIMSGLAAYWLWSRVTPNSLTMYYASWCPHCQSILPLFQAFRYPGITIRLIEEKVNKEMKVAGFPTFVYRNAQGTPEIYNGSRTIEGWSTFLASKVHN